jgi:hypothetical protein
MPGTLSRTARVSGVTRNLKEAAGKFPARRTGTAYEAQTGWTRGRIDSKSNGIRNRLAYMRRAWEEGHASYPERSVVLPRADRAETFGDGTAEVRRGHSSCGQTAAKGRTFRTLRREPFVT